MQALTWLVANKEVNTNELIKIEMLCKGINSEISVFCLTCIQIIEHFIFQVIYNFRIIVEIILVSQCFLHIPTTLEASLWTPLRALFITFWIIWLETLFRINKHLYGIFSFLCFITENFIQHNFTELEAATTRRRDRLRGLHP